MRKRVLAVIGAVLAGGVLMPAAALAMGAQTGDRIGLAKGKTHDGTLYAAGASIKVEGTLNGDLVCAGQSVKVTGVVHGDVLCAAQEITVAGRVDGSVRVAAQTVNINGVVGRNVNIAAQDLATGTDSSVGGEVAFAGENASIYGPVKQTVYGAASKIVLDAPITGDVSLQTAELELGAEAKLGGNLDYTAERESFIDNEKIAGKVRYHMPVVEKKTWQENAAAAINDYLFWTVAVLLIAFALILAAPKAVSRSIRAMRAETGVCFGWGAVAMFALPVAAAITVATGYGLPLGLLTLLLWILLLSLAGSIAAIAAGRLILERLKWHEGSLYMAALVGVPVAMLAWALPLIGGLVAFVTAIWAMGALAINLRVAR